jgi:PII-like signaling protein
MDIKGKCKLLKIYISEDAMYKGHNLYHSVVMKLKELGIAGVTVTRGIEGYGKGKRLRTVRLIELSASFPIIIEAIDKEENIEKALPFMEEMVGEGVIILTDVDVIKYGKDS